ncbi:MAG: hypothetical protein IKD28_00465, partial [Clostridia bacterium]|nr:hypothetical protein [Clostridia bacterium]
MLKKQAKERAQPKEPKETPREGSSNTPSLASTPETPKPPYFGLFQSPFLYKTCILYKNRHFELWVLIWASLCQMSREQNFFKPLRGAH